MNEGINSDFKIKFLDLCPAILSVAKERSKFDSSDQLLIDGGKQYIAALICLVKMFGKILKNRKRDSSGTTVQSFDINQQDMVSSFIHNCPSLEDFKIFKERRTAYSKASGHSTEPFITLVGNFLEDASDQVTVYITVHGQDFCIISNSLLDGV